MAICKVACALTQMRMDRTDGNHAMLQSELRDSHSLYFLLVALRCLQYGLRTRAGLCQWHSLLLHLKPDGNLF